MRAEAERLDIFTLVPTPMVIVDGPGPGGGVASVAGSTASGGGVPEAATLGVARSGTLKT